METRPYEIPVEIGDMLSQSLARAEPGQVFLIPRSIEDGVAIYQDSHILAAKELRASGVDAAFLAESEDRTFVSEFSHDIVYAIAIGIASNVSWDTAKAIWAYVRARSEGLARKGETPMVRLQIAKFRHGNKEIEGLTLEAPATDEVPEALLRALVGNEGDD
jgi:hypothetical protein